MKFCLAKSTPFQEGHACTCPCAPPRHFLCGRYGFSPSPLQNKAYAKDKVSSLPNTCPYPHPLSFHQYIYRQTTNSEMSLLRDLGFEAAIHGLRGQLTDRLDVDPEPRLSHRSVSTSTSTANSSLLTPPVLETFDSEIPFKPKDDDHVSLSMKKPPRKSRAHSKRAAMSTESGLFNETAPPLSEEGGKRSGSLPTTFTYQHEDDSHATWSCPSYPSDRPMADHQREGLPRQRRRWTMPSKGLPTRAVANTSPTFVPPPKRSIPAQTPAMISLRRATLDPRRPDVYTSFPEPIFRQRTGFFASLGLRREPPETDDSNQSSGLYRRASIVDKAVQPPLPSILPPVFTQVELLSSLNPQDACGRRFSARYISNNNEYEIIWDENAAQSVSSSSTVASRKTSTGTKKHLSSAPDSRRHSVAMQRLEMELSKAVPQSRSASPIEESEGASFPREHYDLIRSFRGFTFPGSSDPDGVASLSNWVQSTASAQTSGNDQARTVPQIDFFPPLSSEPTTDESFTLVPETTPEGALIQPTETPLRSRPGPAIAIQNECIDVGRRSAGSLLGASAHMRKRSLDQWRRKSSPGTTAGADRLAGWRRSSQKADITSRRASAWIQRRLLAHEETQPLLVEPEG